MIAIGAYMKYNNSMNKKIILAMAAVLCAASVTAGCNKSSGGGSDFYFQDMPKAEQISGDAVEVYGHVMGTDAILRVCDGGKFQGGAYDKAVKLWKDICDMLVSVNDSISVTVKSSYIAAFNGCAAGGRVELNKTAYDVLSLAVAQYEVTGGYYNPAVYHSSVLYGFDPHGKNGLNKPDSLPSAEDTEAFRRLSAHFSEIGLEEKDGRYYATKPAQTVTVGGVEYSLAIDLGGIGKGWCADRAEELFASSGLSCGFFNFGSSSISFMSNLSDDGAFNVAARDPRVNGKSYVRLKVKDESLSTSGDYEKYYEADGARYCHVIDPTTGAPIQTGVASVTIVGGSAAENDALTTALMAMGREKAEEYIAQKADGRKFIMLVFEEGKGYAVCNCPQDITLLNENYTVVAV